MAWVTLVIALALIEFMVFGTLVGWARGRYGIRAPAITGHPMFERYMRVQQNTMETLVIFIPALWLFATYMSANVGALLGLVFIASRALYAFTYVKNPTRRGAGAMSTGLVLFVLVVGAAIGAAKTLFQ
jgi:glutathione S-transferase